MTRRRTFTKKTMREARARSGGRCEAIGVWYGLPSGQRCNADLSKGVQYDHVVRFADGGESELSNCAAVCVQCHAHKTAKFDIPEAAKTKRISDKHQRIVDNPRPMQGKPLPTTTKAARRKKNAADKLPMPGPRQMFRSER